MIRTRLAIVFSALAALALLQSAFAWWAASTAAHHAERSVNAARMLAEYLEISGNKQRLKVWFAQRMLADDPAPEVRATLMASIQSSLDALSRLAEAAPEELRDFEREEVATVALNIAAMGKAIEEAERPEGDPRQRINGGPCCWPLTNWPAVTCANCCGRRSSGTKPRACRPRPISPQPCDGSGSWRSSSPSP